MARRVGWIAVLALLLLATLLVAPFLVTTELARFALGRLFPEHRPVVGGATLGLSGTLVLRDLALHETEGSVEEPLATAREVGADFHWAELFSRRIRRIHGENVAVYVRSGGGSQVSLMGLFLGPSGSGEASEPDAAPPFWIDVLDVEGTVHQSPVPGLVPAGAEWPVTARMTTSGDRKAPSRQLRVSIGDVRQLPESIFEAATDRSAGGKAVFGLGAEIDTGPARGGTRIVLRRLAARRAAAAIDARVLRRYLPAFPAEVRGRIDASLGGLWLSGELEPGAGAIRGRIRLQDLSLRSRGAGSDGPAVERLTVAATVDSRLDRWAPAALGVRDGSIRWAALTYGRNAMRNLDASWRVERGVLTIDRFAARIFDGEISGSPTWNLLTRSMPSHDLRIRSIDMHEALANVSPEHLDAEGDASGSVRLEIREDGELSGHVNLAFDGPGVLEVGEVEEVKQMLAGNFGLDLANLAMRDLRHYPFREGTLYLESAGRDSQLKIRFVRQPRTGGEATTPQKRIIDGQEVWVGSLVVPVIDMTIPITGRSLAEILSMVGGLRPRIEDGGTERK